MGKQTAKNALWEELEPHFLLLYASTHPVQPLEWEMKVHQWRHKNKNLKEVLFHPHSFQSFKNILTRIILSFYRRSSTFLK